VGVKGTGIIFGGILGILAVAGCDEGMDTIGPEGGVVTSRDGRVALEIPPGALEGEVAVTIEKVDGGPDGAIGDVYEILPTHTQLLFPATIEIDLSMAKGDGSVEPQLSAAAMEDVVVTTARGDSWRDLADLDVDTESELVTASVMYFSTYALVLAE
jgi:hypothetical protein